MDICRHVYATSPVYKELQTQFYSLYSLWILYDTCLNNLHTNNTYLQSPTQFTQFTQSIYLQTLIHSNYTIHVNRHLSIQITQFTHIYKHLSTLFTQSIHIYRHLLIQFTQLTHISRTPTSTIDTIHTIYTILHISALTVPVYRRGPRNGECIACSGRRGRPALPGSHGERGTLPRGGAWTLSCL